MTRSGAALGLGLLAATGSAAAAGLDVTVANVANDRGEVRIAACGRDTFLSTDCVHVAAAPAKAGVVRLTIPDLPPGVYAVQAFHDENLSRDIDRSFFGTPREGIGFSNDAPINFGPPEFDAAAVEVNGDPVAIEFRLKYFD